MQVCLLSVVWSEDCHKLLIYLSIYLVTKLSMENASLLVAAGKVRIESIVLNYSEATWILEMQEQ